MEHTSRHAVIIAAHPEIFEPLVTQAGYEIAGVCDLAVNGERLAAHFQPDVIVVENELTGILGLEAVSHLNAASPRSQILLVIADEWRPSDLASMGAFAVVTRSHLERLASELTDLGDWISQHVAGASPPLGERRLGRERREHQDWSLVGFEKRGGGDRRPAGAELVTPALERDGGDADLVALG